LQEIAGMFSAVGMCEQAVAAFTKVHPIEWFFIGVRDMLHPQHSSTHLSVLVGPVEAGFYNFSSSISTHKNQQSTSKK